MLKILRHKGVAKKILWVIAGIIIISFGFGFGISNFSSNVSLTDSAGKAFGSKVSIKEFREKYIDTRDQALLMYGDKFRKVSAMMDLNNEAWTRLLLVKEADQRNIKVSDAEVIAFIQSIPFFQHEGAFDRKSYENIVKYSFQRDPRLFEEGLRDQIKIMKMFRSETMGINIPDETVRKEYERRNQKVKVSYLLIDPKTFTRDIAPTEKELQDYFSAHQADFLEPDSVNVQYALFATNEKMTNDAKSTVQEKASAFYKKTKNADDFTSAAKAAGALIRETGFFNMEQLDSGLDWPLDLLQKVFEAKKGDMLEPVETIQGIQILKISDKKLAFIPEFNKAQKAIQEKWIADKSLTIAKEKSKEVHKSLLTKLSIGMSFEATAQTLSIEKKTTPFFGLGEYVPEIGISDDFASAAFTLNKEHPVSDVVLTSRGPVILKWEALQPIDEKKFEELKKDFTDSLVEEQRISTMNRVIKEIKEKAGLESYLDKIKP